MRRLGSVRARTTLLATLVASLALAVGAVALLVTLRQALVRDADHAAQTRARDLADLAAAGALSGPLAASGEDDVVQVVDPSGRVVAASANYGGRPPVTTFVPAGRRPEVRVVRRVSDGSSLEDYRVWAVNAGTPQGRVTVYVATNLDSVSETVGTVRNVLAAGLPPLLLLLAGGTWLLLRRSLQPVEAIRAEVADISVGALDRRVPEPPGDDEIGRLARTMNAMLARLEESARRQRTFVADASHELQSPLAAFRSELEVALADPGSADWETTGRALLEDTGRMERLVRDLLFLARDEEAPAPPATAPIDLDDVVLEEVARLRPATRVRLDTSRVSAAPVLGHRDDLAGLVRNLLDNAERHAVGEVRVALTAGPEVAELVVADDGPGIVPGDAERVFGRFVRLDGARSRDQGGTGLGLAIVRSVARRHGGSVRVAPPDPRRPGAAFVVRLPVSPVPGEPKGRAARVPARRTS